MVEVVEPSNALRKYNLDDITWRLREVTRTEHKAGTTPGSLSNTFSCFVACANITIVSTNKAEWYHLLRLCGFYRYTARYSNGSYCGTVDINQCIPAHLLTILQVGVQGFSPELLSVE